MKYFKFLIGSENARSNDPADYAAFILRVGLGIVFISHALLKLLIFTLPGTADFFIAHGFPGWAAYPVFAGELLGGIALVFGVLTRLVSILLLPITVGAFLTHYPNGWSFTANGGGYEYIAFLLIALAVQILLGNGVFAVQNIIHKDSLLGDI